MLKRKLNVLWFLDGQCISSSVLFTANKARTSKSKRGNCIAVNNVQILMKWAAYLILVRHLCVLLFYLAASLLRRRLCEGLNDRHQLGLFSDGLLF